MVARLAFLMAVLAPVSVSSWASAALVLYEGFDYASPGVITGENGGYGWPAGSGWQGSASMSVAGSGLTYGALTTSGNAAEVSSDREEANYRSWDSGLFTGGNGALWFSFLLDTSATTSDLRVFPLGSTGTTGAGVFIANNTVRADIAAQRSGSLALDSGETNLIVARIGFSDASGEDSVRVWVNPSLDEQPTTGYVEQKGDFPLFTSGEDPLPYNFFIRGGST